MSNILNETIGRATNDQLEEAIALWFKSEDDDDGDGMTIGPLFLELPAPSHDRPLLIPFRKGEEAEWFRLDFAEALAAELALPLRAS